MDDEKLIQLVLQHECLINKFNKNYKFPEKKKFVGIAKELEVTDEQCVRRWTTLRDGYTKECCHLNAPSERSASTERQWQFIEAMSFLRQHVSPRPLRCSKNVYNSSQSNTDSIKRMLPLPSPTESQASLQMSPPSPTDSLVSHTFSLTEDFSKDSKTSFFVPTPSPTNTQCDDSQLSLKKKKNQKLNTSDVDKTFCDAVEIFKKECAAREEERGNAAVVAFGQMIVSIVSNMSSNKQVKAMQRVMDVVMALALEPEE